MNLSHNSRQVAKCPTNLVHGIVGADNSASSRFKVQGSKSNFGYAQNLGRGPLRAKLREKLDELCSKFKVQCSRFKGAIVLDSN